jgi:polyphosphate glucokinase
MENSDLRILTIDVGGTGLKAAVLDADGNILTERLRVKTPHPCPPQVLLEAILVLVGPFAGTGYNRIAIGFPGVVRRGVVLTAPMLGTEGLRGYPLAAEIADRLGQPTRLINDADLQGLAVIHGQGVEMVITLGTGVGTALFSEGQLGPHLELSVHRFRQGETYNEQLGDATLQKIGKAKWNRRVRRAILNFRTLTTFDRMYIGGGNARLLDFELPPDVEVVSNENGVKGGAFLWRLTAEPA